MGLKLDYLSGQTPIDDSEKEGLLIRSIATREDLDEFEQQNIERAIQWTIGKKWKTADILTEKFVKELHKKMYGQVWKWAGTFRKTEKNIGVTSYLVPVELNYLLQDTLFWIDKQTYEQEEIAIRFKHRLVSIHCFPNGNGRHSRLMADLLMEKGFGKSFFSWGGKGLVQANEQRKNYIEALRKADQYDIKSLLDFAKS